MTDQNKARLFRQFFYGRQDVYGRKWESAREDGTKVGGYAPVCANLWSEGCHLRLKDGVRCDSCEIKKHVPVTDGSALKHIHGDEQQIAYVLQTDGTIKFGAIDFDMKPGKEDKGYGWPDVKRVIDLLQAWRIPYRVARSTGNGFHVYFFFEDFYPAARFRAFVMEVYERAGFMEYLRTGVKSLPEVFPKQAYNSNDGIGNGIKPPLAEHRFAVERNCFVDDENVMIGLGGDVVAAQWDYLAASVLITTAQLDALIEAEKIPVYEDSLATQNRAGVYGGMALGGGRKRGQWQPAMNGSIEKVLEGCKALRKVKDKCAAGQVPGHAEGMALFHAAMHTNDGMAWFKKNVPGWGQSDSDIKQLEHSLAKDYSPHTCRKLQENSVCIVGTVCFKKRPPVETVEGQLVSRTDVPEKDWPEPSPIRYAFGTGEDFLKRLTDEVYKLRDERDHDRLVEGLKAIAYRAQVFDAEQQKELRAFIKALKTSDNEKVIKAGEIPKIFNEAAERSNEELKEELSKSVDVVTCDGVQYRKLYPFGYGIVRPSRSKTTTTPVCNVDIVIEEERSYIDEEQVAHMALRGRCSAKGMEKRFELDSDKFARNDEFLGYFFKLMGGKFNVLRQNLDAIRHGAMGFSYKQEVIRSTFLTTQGWYQDSYLMPSAVVDREGVKPNTEQRVDLAHKDFARNLDFKILSEDDMRDTLMHIKTDLLNTWPRLWSTVGLAHTFVPALIKPLNIKQKPTLFYEGLTGAGKTELTHALQYFWGDFDKLVNLTSTGKGMLSMAYEFRDALLVLDDFKGLDQRQKHDVKLVLQYAYDGHAGVKLKRDSSFQPSKSSRAIIMASGEEFVTSEASVVARTILIEVDKHDTRRTRDSFRRCEEMRKNYSGVTAKFIQWFLTHDRKDLKDVFYTARNDLQEKIADRQNAGRIAFNLALNHLSWTLIVDFMLANGVVSHKEKDELRAEHQGYLYDLAREIADRCEEEQSGIIFARVLKQLIDTGEVSVLNLPGHERERKPVVGYVPKRDVAVNVVFFHPEMVWKAVQDYSRNIAVGGSLRSIGRQMVDLGIICDHDRGHSTKQIREGEIRRRVWIVDIEKLGLARPLLRVVGQTEPLEFRPGTPDLAKDEDGIF